MEMRLPRLVLWDWNGTLLDDAQYAIYVRNRVFPRFGLQTLDGMAAYHAQFTFPVKQYYLRAGVTEENFVAVANAWMDEYVRGAQTVPLFSDATPALDAFHAVGCKQVVLSASKREMLTEQLAFAGISERFDAVLGLSHIYATSKESIGLDYLLQSEIDPRDALMLGDTLHDAEVAATLQCRCILVARGHQSKETLQLAGVPVVDDLAQAVSLVLGRNPTHE